IADVDHKFLRYYFAMLKEKGKSASTINRSISALKSFYKFLQREKLVQNNPMRLIQWLKTPKKLPLAVAKDKLNLLLETMEEAEENFERIRDFIVLDLLFGIGMRLSELLPIKGSDIPLSNYRVLIFGRRNADRFIAIPARLKEECTKCL